MGNTQTAEMCFDRYLDSVPVELRYEGNEWAEYEPDSCLSPWLWYIINNVSRLSNPVTGFSFLIKYAEMADCKMGYSEATFYYLYKETVSRAKAAIESVPLCE